MRAPSILALVLILFVLSCGKESPPEKRKGPFPVTTVTVEKRDIPISFDYIADTQSSHKVDIQARVSGFLDKRVYKEGDIVKEGEVLFLMDDKPFVAQVNAAKGALAMREAAKATAELTYNRTKPLTELNALSQKDLDDAKGSLESASAAVEMAKAELETALLNLSYCTIHSPIEGITGAAVFQEGAYISVLNGQLTTVSALDPIWVNFSISEMVMQKFRREVEEGTLIPAKNNEYEIEIFMVDGTRFPEKGVITFTQPYYNSDTGTFLIRSSVKNPGDVLRPNMILRVRVHGTTRPQTVALPLRAVLQSSKGHYVWVVKDSNVEQRPVTVGEWYGDLWVIKEGLFPDERVVIDGSLALFPGASVTETKEK